MFSDVFSGFNHLNDYFQCFFGDAIIGNDFFQLFSMVAIVGANDDRQRSFAQVYHIPSTTSPTSYCPAITAPHQLTTLMSALQQGQPEVIAVHVPASPPPAGGRRRQDDIPLVPARPCTVLPHSYSGGGAREQEDWAEVNLILHLCLCLYLYLHLCLYLYLYLHLCLYL